MAPSDVALARQNAFLHPSHNFHLRPSTSNHSVVTPGELAMRSLMMRRALGAAAAFEKQARLQKGGAGKYVSTPVQVGGSTLSLVPFPPLLAANALQSSGIAAAKASSFSGRTAVLAAVLDSGGFGGAHRAQPGGITEGRNNAVGNGALETKARGETGAVVGTNDGSPPGDDPKASEIGGFAVERRSGKDCAGDKIMQSRKVPATVLSGSSSFNGWASGQGYATQAAPAFNDTAENDVVLDSEEGVRVSKLKDLAAARGAQARAAIVRKQSLGVPPPTPNGKEQRLEKVKRVIKKPSTPALKGPKVQRTPPAKGPANGLAPVSPPAPPDESPVAVLDISETDLEKMARWVNGVPNLRPPETGFSQDTRAPAKHNEDGAKQLSPLPTAKAALNGATPAPETNSTLPPLAANGNPKRPRGRPPTIVPPFPKETPPSPPVAETATPNDAPVQSVAPSNGSPTPSNGSAMPNNGTQPPPKLPVMNNIVQPVSKAGNNGAVGKQPEVVGPAPLRDLLEENGIILPDYTPGSYRILCPMCKGGDSKEESLGVTVKSGDHALWHCFRGKCGWASAVRSRYPNRSASQFGGSYSPSTKTRETALQKKRFPAAKLPRVEEFDELDEEALTFFKNRKIGEGTLARNGVKKQHAFSPQLGTKVDALVFPYMRRGELVNVKYRGPDKLFWQAKGAEKVFYGLDDIAESKTVIIVEGEMDKLAMEEAGYLNCVSVPDGAPAKAAAPGTPLPPPEDDRKYEYLWNCREYLDKASKFLLATDSDEPGQALSEELARRLGREKCWRVKWPVTGGDVQIKDANEALMRVGKSGVREAVEGAEAFPIRGLFKFESFFEEIDDYYNLQLGDERGVSTGWAGLDDLYRIVPGELSVVTGVPNSGKSEWLDALLCNLVDQRGWNFALCSMENKVRDHARKLIEKFVGAPFFDAPYGEQQPRISPEQLEKGKAWINEHFHVIRCEDDELPSIEWVLGLARAAVLRNGIRGLVIDPYNELDHQRPSRQTETEYVSQMLTKIKRFAQHHDCHVWFVAHPKQLQQWKGEAPGLYDISGSAHFVNKTDNGIVVHRNRDPESGPLDEVKILVRKVRNKAAGTIGEASLKYDRVTGRYEDVLF